MQTQWVQDLITALEVNSQAVALGLLVVALYVARQLLVNDSTNRES
jgi:hypothetical protein